MLGGDLPTHDAVHDVGAALVSLLTHLPLGEILHLLVAGGVGARWNLVGRIVFTPRLRIFDDVLLLRPLFQRLLEAYLGGHSLFWQLHSRGHPAIHDFHRSAFVSLQHRRIQLVVKLQPRPLHGELRGIGSTPDHPLVGKLGVESLEAFAGLWG